jgi:hypothetical protein
MRLLLFIFISFLSVSSTWAQIRDLQTARLNSAAGTGVASILMTEGAILNPASSAFFDGSGLSYQNTTVSLKNENDLRKSDPSMKWDSPRTQAAFASDHSGSVKGGISYQNQKENGFERTRYTLHGASMAGKNASVGLLYRYTEDERPEQYSTKRHKTFHQLVIGSTLVASNDLTIGFVVVDPTKSNKGDERLLTGFQYNITEKFLLSADAGMQQSRSIQSRYLWRAAVQFNIFSDFYIRAGKFYDHITFFEGSGWGISWIGPKLGIEFAQKFSERIPEKNTYLLEKEKIVDTTLSAVLRF